MSSFNRISYFVFFYAALVMCAALIPSPAAAQGGNYQVESRSDGGVMVKFSSGCMIVYDRNANRGSHSGNCGQYEYNNADNAAANYLRGGAAQQGGGGAGVVLYRDNNFRGGSETINHDVADMKGTRIGNDSLSSIRVPPGCRAVLFSDNNFRGNSVVLQGDEAELGRTRVGNDSVSSIEVNCGGQSGGYESAQQGVPQGQMQRYCQGEASGSLGVRPTEISTSAVQRINGGRFAVQGQTPQSGYNVTRFECTFDPNGVFEQVLVTGRPGDYGNNANNQSNQGDIPPAARSRCLSTFGGGGSSRVTKVSALRPGYWEVMMENGANGRSVACTVTASGQIEDWVELN